MSSKRSTLRIALITIVVVGFACTIYFNQKRSRLRHTLTELQKEVGVWKVEDESKVVIARIPVPDEAIPPGVGKAYVWQYRIHIPANYGLCYQQIRGLIKADSPQVSGGGSGGSSSPSPEPEDIRVSVALIQMDGNWLFSNSVGGSSGSSSMPSDFKIESLDELVIEPIVKEGEVRIFETDEAVCLFRLREKALATDGRGKTQEDLYLGCATYLFSNQHQDAFKAWSQGQKSSMKETPE